MDITNLIQPYTTGKMTRRGTGDWSRASTTRRQTEVQTQVPNKTLRDFHDRQTEPVQPKAYPRILGGRPRVLGTDKAK